MSQAASPSPPEGKDGLPQVKKNEQVAQNEGGDVIQRNGEGEPSPPQPAAVPVAENRPTPAPRLRPKPGEQMVMMERPRAAVKTGDNPAEKPKEKPKEKKAGTEELKAAKQEIKQEAKSTREANKIAIARNFREELLLSAKGGVVAPLRKKKEKKEITEEGPAQVMEDNAEEEDEMEKTAEKMGRKLDAAMDDALILGCISKRMLGTFPLTMVEGVLSLFRPSSMQEVASADSQQRDTAFGEGKADKTNGEMEAEKKFLEQAANEMRGLIAVSERQKKAVKVAIEIFGGDLRQAGAPLKRQIVHVLRNAQFMSDLVVIIDNMSNSQQTTKVLRGFARVMNSHHNMTEANDHILDNVEDEANDFAAEGVDYMGRLRDIVSGFRNQEKDYLERLSSLESTDGDELSGLLAQLGTDFPPVLFDDSPSPVTPAPAPAPFSSPLPPQPHFQADPPYPVRPPPAGQSFQSSLRFEPAARPFPPQTGQPSNQGAGGSGRAFVPAFRLGGAGDS